jgi:hypothetical protein
MCHVVEVLLESLCTTLFGSDLVIHTLLLFYPKLILKTERDSGSLICFSIPEERANKLGGLLLPLAFEGSWIY